MVQNHVYTFHLVVRKGNIDGIVIPVHFNGFALLELSCHVSILVENRELSLEVVLEAV